MEKRFISKSKVKEFAVVADAAMISSENIMASKENGIHCIAGARLGNVLNCSRMQKDNRCAVEEKTN